MRSAFAVSIAAAAVFALSAVSAQADFAKDFTACVDKFATNPKASADVMLACTAAGGKLQNCTVKEGPNPANGFDKAAMCVADILPIGSRTGLIDVPLKFNPK